MWVTLAREARNASTSALFIMDNERLSKAGSRYLLMMIFSFS
nr:hypothetical protein [Moraxella lacunata]